MYLMIVVQKLFKHRAFVINQLYLHSYAKKVKHELHSSFTTLFDDSHNLPVANHVHHLKSWEYTARRIAQVKSLSCLVNCLSNRSPKLNW
jgi:hypothetical protein